jgi:translation initiation factor 1 (eIF-1/SUI1)
MKVRLSKLLVCLFLGFGSVMGMAMRPEEIAELMCAMNQTVVETTIPEAGDKDDPLKKILREQGVKLD